MRHVASVILDCRSLGIQVVMLAMATQCAVSTQHTSLLVQTCLPHRGLFETAVRVYIYLTLLWPKHCRPSCHRAISTAALWTCDSCCITLAVDATTQSAGMLHRHLSTLAAHAAPPTPSALRATCYCLQGRARVKQVHSAVSKSHF